MPKIISDEHYESIRLFILNEADRQYEIDANDFWEHYYYDEYASEYEANGYVGSDNDKDGTLFRDWYINHYILSMLDCFENYPADDKE